MDLVSALQSIPGVGPALPWIMGLIAVCAALAPMLPPPKAQSGQVYPVLYTLVNWVALNFGHAKNANVPGTLKPPGAVVWLLALIGAGALLPVACTQQQLGTVDGQLICTLVKDGVPIATPVVQAGAMAAGGPMAGALAVMVVGQTAGWVQARCDEAAKAAGAQVGIPVAPPPAGAPMAAPVAIPPVR